jgi:putative hydrolase of the HAD superfamily
MKVKTLLFTIDDTLYDASIQRKNALLNAVRAMIEAGLPLTIENGYTFLQEIVTKYGVDYSRHFDKFLSEQGLNWNPGVVAAGVVAYRETNQAFLKPYPDTTKTLLMLRDHGYILGIVSDGRPVKQWQKLIQLGLQHFFHEVVISDYPKKRMTAEILNKALKVLDTKPGKAVFIGNRLHDDISVANKVGLISIRLRKGEDRIAIPKSVETKPKFEINTLSEILEVLKKIEE